MFWHDLNSMLLVMLDNGLRIDFGEGWGLRILKLFNFEGLLQFILNIYLLL